MQFETVDIQASLGVQIIELPKRFNIDDSKVYLKKVGNSIHIIPFHNPWESMIESVSEFSEDFMEERTQPENQNRELF